MPPACGGGDGPGPAGGGGDGPGPASGGGGDGDGAFQPAGCWARIGGAECQPHRTRYSAVLVAGMWLAETPSEQCMCTVEVVASAA